MKDMTPESIVGEYAETELTFCDGSKRVVYVTDIETPMPSGRLIVSRTDPKGIITHVNQSFVDMSGYSEDELINSPQHILRHPDMPAAAFKDLWDTISKNQKWHGYVKNLRKDGGFYWVYATVIPNIRQGKLVGYSSIRRKPSREKIEQAEAMYKVLQA